MTHEPKTTPHSLGMAGFQNRHRGERCVIIGNGPSLKRMDLGFLKNEVTFGLNKIFLGFETWDFRPTYYVSVNPLVLRQNVPEILAVDCPKFLSRPNALGFFPPRDDIFYLETFWTWIFSKDASRGIFEGYTVTYVALQLAYFMGFERVYLIGVDHSFMAQGAPNQEVVSQGSDPNHFHDDYFGKGVSWHLPDLENSERAYTLARMMFEGDGRNVFDATYNGKLTIFPKVDYQKVFLEGKEPEPGPTVPRTLDLGADEFVKGIVLSLRLQDFEQACTLSEQGAKQYPGNQDLMLLRARSLRVSGRFEDAARSVKQSLKQGITPGAFEEMVLIKLQTDQKGEARMWAEKAVQSFPDFMKSRICKTALVG